MFNWRSWLLPGLVTTVVLTALAIVFHAGAIERDLSGKAIEDLSASHDWATVELDGRDLTLTGMAPDPEAQGAAEAIARAVYDVRVVRNQSELLRLADPYLFKAVKAEDGVTLSGHVPDETVRAAIIGSAETAMPAIAINDTMDPARGNPEQFGAMAAFALNQLAGLSEGEVALTETEYSISGTAANSEAYEALVATTSGDLPDGADLGSVDVSPPLVAGPYLWTATRTDDNTIRLTGFSPSVEARSAVVSLAHTSNPDATIIDELEIAAEAPDGFDELTALALRQMAGISSGSVELVDNTYAITGLTVDQAAFEQISATLANPLPAGATLASASILPPASPDSYSWTAAKGADGTVTLGGLMPSQQASSDAAARAGDLNPGVDIVNQIQIADGAPESFIDHADYALRFLPTLLAGKASLSGGELIVQGFAVDGDRLETAALIEAEAPQDLALTVDITLQAADGQFEVVATRTDDVLVLTGFAPSNADKAQILEAANALTGVTVVDRIEVAAGAPDGVNWGEAGAFAVSGLDGIANGTAALRGNELFVDGEASDTASLNAAQEAWSRALPAGITLSSSAIRFPIVSPFGWQAELDEEALRVTGYVPSDEAADNVAAEISAVFGSRVTVENRQLRGSGAPAGFEAAASVGIIALGRLESGVVSITDNELVLTGTVFSPSAKSDIETKLANGVPPGFSGSSELTVLAAPLEPGGLGRLASDACQLELNNLLAGGQIRFATAEASIEQTSFGLLDRLAYTARACPDAIIRVDGHTDSDGDAVYNQGLSEQRANAVRDYLVEAGVEAVRLQARGFGETQPIASNATAEGKAANRRIQFSIIQ